MGCFLGCFGSSKRRKPRAKQTIKPHHSAHYERKNVDCSALESSTVVNLAVKQPEKEIASVPGKEVLALEQSGLGTPNKKVKFDSNVRTYEDVLPEEDTGENCDGGTKGEAQRTLVELGQSQYSSDVSSVTSSSGSYPANHRYQNCRESDDEVEDELIDDEDDDGVLDCDDLTFDDDDYETVESNNLADTVVIGDGSVMRNEEGGVKPIRANGTARDRSGYVHSVLNPVENLSQWKALKTKGKPQLKHQKENLGLEEEPARVSFSLEPRYKEVSLSFKSKLEHQSNKPKQEIAVDTSLSNWLSSSEATSTPISKPNTVFSNSPPPQSSSSPWSQDDRPILGALTLEEIKQFSASSSPRKSPSRSPDEMPIIGTVGTYWTHTAKDSVSASSYKGIPNTTSKYREDKRVNWHSTPFETRLERALNRGAAEAFSANGSEIC